MLVKIKGVILRMAMSLWFKKVHMEDSVAKRNREAPS
jgi:hypothetical protein